MGPTGRVPMLDVESVGGRRLLGWIDQGGALKDWAASAGSTPGPVCYGRGGCRADPVGALLLKVFLADELAGWPRAARQGGCRAACDAAAGRAAWPPARACDPRMIEIAQSNMANAARSVSIWKGLIRRT